MKILILSQYFWPETFRINEVATSLHKLGIDVTVLTGQAPQARGYRQEPLGISEVSGCKSGAKTVRGMKGIGI